MSALNSIQRIVNHLRHKGQTHLDRDAWRFLGRYMRPQLRQILSYGTLNIIVAQGNLLNLLALGILFRKAIPSGDYRYSVMIGVSYVVLRILLFGIGVFFNLKMTDLLGGCIENLRMDQMRLVLRGSHMGQSPRDIRIVQSQMVTESRHLKDALVVILEQTIPHLVTLILMFTGVAILNPILLPAMMVLLFIYFILLRVIGFFLQKRIREKNLSDQDYQSHVSLVFHFLDHIRMRRTEGRELEAHGVRLGRLRRAINELALNQSMNRFANLLIQSLVFLVFVIMGAKMAVQGSVSIGDLAVLLICLNMIFTQFSALLGGYSRFLDAGEALKTLKGVEDGMDVWDEWLGKLPMPPPGSFNFHDVSFSYPGREILKGIHFTIAPGESVALVGKNGSGKTTLIHLLMGLKRPDTGSVHYGDIDLADIDISKYRSAIGFVPQNPRLLPGSVRDNLTYGREGVTEGEIQEALRLSMATEVVERLDKGLDTVLGEEGARLSGGERQRLAIASAILGHPRLLIMDEPTNHLDSDAIRQLVANIRQFPHSPTILFASHDREMLRLADRILVLEEGRLRESVHGELAARPLENLQGTLKSDG